MAPKTVLVVDDSGVYRMMIKRAIETDASFSVTAVAANGRIAMERLAQGSFDFVVTDLEMPEVDGLSLLEQIKTAGLRVKPIVFSAHSRRGADLTLRALALGALDFALKPLGTATSDDPVGRIGSQLLPILRALSHSTAPPNVATAVPGAAARPKSAFDWTTFRPSLVVIAASTGGPSALDELLVQVRAPLNFPILVAQHMPPVFTTSLALRLGKSAGMPSEEAKSGELITAGRIYVAPGDYHLRVGGTPARVELTKGPLRNSVRPACDELFESAAAVARSRTLAIVLTGMGEDGKLGAMRIKEVGGAVIIQSRETCSVYGMPAAVEAVGAFDRIASPRDIGVLIDRLGKNFGQAV